MEARRRERDTRGGEGREGGKGTLGKGERVVLGGVAKGNHDILSWENYHHRKTGIKESFR